MNKRWLRLGFNRGERIIPVNVTINILDLTHPTDLDSRLCLSYYY